MIRPAEHSDVGALADLGAAFHAEIGSFTAFDRDSFIRSCEAWLDTAIFLVADAGEVVGMICGFVAPVYFNQESIIAHELFWWVAPDHRNGVGQQLLDGFADEARARGATHEIQTTAESARIETLNSMYRRKGFRPIERAYVREL